MDSKSFLHIVCSVLVIYQLCISPAHSQEAPGTNGSGSTASSGSSNSSNLDLGSGDRTITAGSTNNNFTAATITVGGTSVLVNAGSLLTPAESVALNQVLGGGTQSLVLDAAGRAVGGQFMLTSANLNQLVIPTGVTALHDFGTAGSISITGNLSNSGSFFALSSNSQFNTALISAGNILNNQGGLISSVLPAGGFAGFGNLLSSVNLSLMASNNITNYGSITSSGNLNLFAGNTIVNALPTGMTGPSPIMQAVGDISMISNAVQNAGLIASLSGNINIASQLVQNLTISNFGGTLEALNGNINVRDQFFSDKFDTNLLGGDFLSKQLNVFSGDGIINIDVNAISGQLNMVGGSAHVASTSGDLHIGAIRMSGDPTISSAGDVFLEMSQFGGNWLFPGPELLMINAGKNIINVDVTAIGTTAGKGNTGNIVMTAGGMIDLQTVPVATISTESFGATSGNITLSAGGPILLGSTQISTKSTGGQAGFISITSKNSNIVSSGLFSLDSSATGGNAGQIDLTAKSGITAGGGINFNSSSDTGFAGAINITATNGNLALGNSSGKTDINASSLTGTAGQVFAQALNGSFISGDGLIDVSAKQGGAGAFSIYTDKGSVSFGKSTIDASGFNGGFISVLTSSGVADINMANVSIVANGGSSGGFSGSVNISSGINGASEVQSDNLTLGSIEVNNGDSSYSNISLSTSAGDLQVGSIVSNGAGINLTAGSNIRVDSISDDNNSGLGAFININANMNKASDAFSSTLLFNQTGGNNYIGSTSANSAGGGGLFVSNHGSGGIQVGNVALNASIGDAGMIALTADGDIVLGGSSYSANGGVTGAGGQIFINSGTRIVAGDLNFSATGGSDYAGGTLSLNAPELQIGNLTSDTSGHGSGSAGSVGIGGNTISASSMNITNNGGGVSAVQIGGSVHVDVLSVTARGGDEPGKLGGNIAINLTDGVHGALILDAGGASSGGGGSITVTSNTDLDLSGANTKISSRGGADGGNGGFLYLSSNGTLTVSGSNLDVSTAAANGNGGSMYLSSGLDAGSASGALIVSGNLNANGTGNGNGGTIEITVLNTQTQSDFSVQNNSAFTLSANSGLDGGNGGTININAGGNLTVDGNALSVAARGKDGDGGTISLNAGATGSNQIGNGNQVLTVSGTLNTNSAGNGDGGEINLRGPQINIIDGATISASALGSGFGGDVFISALGSDADLNLGLGTTIAVRSNSGTGGSIDAAASRNVSLSGSLLDAGSLQGDGGSITLEAGSAGSGLLNVDADIVADAGGSGNGGDLFLLQNSQLAIQIGTLANGGNPGTGLLSASSFGGGKGGNLTLSSGAGNDLSVAVNQNILLAGSSPDALGTINATSSGAVSFSGAATLKGSFNGSGTTYSVSVDGAGSSLGVTQVSSSNGNVFMQASAADGSIVFANNSSLSAQAGTVEIGAAQISFQGTSVISMDNAGLMKIGSGSATNSLAMNFADAANVTFDITQGAAVRPGNILVGASGIGSTSLSSAGNSTIDFTGGTVSITSSGAAISIGAGVDISSTAFDDTQNLGMEIVATNGNINLDGSLSAKQLNVTAVNSGNINIGGDIIAPMASLTVQGSSSINQTGDGTIGIGTLVLSSQSGNIGSSLRPLETNVLEIMATSGGSVYLNNAASVDVKTSTVAGTFQLNNAGDISIESKVLAGNLDFTADGDISIFNGVDGSNGVALSTGDGNALSVAAGIDLASSKGSLTLNTDNLLLDGNVFALGNGAGISINSDGDLNMSGSAGQISSGSGGIAINGQKSVTFANAYTFNAGSNGAVQVSTGNAGSGVTVTSSLSVNGGSQLAINTNALNLGSGSSINLSRASGSAMLLNSSLGSALNVNVNNSATINSQGGSMEFHAGATAPLNFNRQGAGTAQLNFNGGQLITESSAADTNLNNVNLQASGNIQVNVHGGNLNLNGDINSSQQNGVIVLQDPNGMTLTGSGSVGFTNGASGSIFVQSFGAGNDLTFAGNNVFNAGAGGNVHFSSQSSIIFAAGASPTVSNGASLDISAGTLVFGSDSKVMASGASAITVSSLSGAPVNVLTPVGGTGTIATAAGGSINILGSGADINFTTASGTGSGTLALLGAPVTISTSNADVTINSGVTVASDNNVSVLAPGGNFINNGLLQTPGGTTTIQAAGNLLIDQNVSASSLIIQTTANNGNITLGANVDVTNDLTVSAHGAGNIYQTKGILTAANITLKSQSGSIGSVGQAINVSTGNLNVSTSGAANVNAIGAVRVDSYNVGGGLTLSASGNIDLGSANASSVAINSNGIFNAGTNGSVNISASDLVSVGSNVSLMVQNSTLNINAAQLDLSTGSSISTNSNLNINTNLLNDRGTISSSATNGVITVSSLPGSSLTLAGATTSNINAKTVNINSGSAVNFDASYAFTAKNGSTNISSAAINLVSGAKLSTTNDGNLNVSGALSMGQNSSISSDGQLALSGSVSGNDYSLASAGNLSLNAALTGNTVSISTKEGGNISLGGNMTANNLNISANGLGNVTQNSGVLSAKTLNIHSDKGSIGTASSAINVNAANLTLESSKGTGLVNVHSTGAVVLNDSESGGNFTITSAGALTANNISTREGSILVSGASTVTVAKQAKLVANEGNLTIQSTNLTNGQITIGKNADLQAFSNSSSSGRGNVRVVIGEVPTNPISGSTPSGVKVSEKYGGNVYFGSKGITVNGNGNKVNAWGSNVIFSTGSLSKSAIVLEGGVHILADPPPAGGAIASMLPMSAALSPAASVSVPVLAIPSSSNASLNLINPASTSSAHASGLLVPQEDLQGQTLQSGTSEKESLQEVAYTSTSSQSISKVLSGSATKNQRGGISAYSDYFKRSQTSTCKIITAACDYQSESSKIAIHKGEMLVNAHKPSEFSSKYGHIKLDSDTSALIKSDEHGLEVYNVYEGHWGGIQVQVGKQHFVIGAGQRLTVGQTSKVAARNEKSHEVAVSEMVSASTVKVAEFALLSLISNSEVLVKLMKSEERQDRQLGARMLKMAACLSVVTSSHGAFKSEASKN